jgi:glycogen synthase
MKLLLYSHFFAPSIGGVETVVYLLANGLSELRNARGEQEFELTLITETPKGKFDDASVDFRIERQPTFALLCGLFREADVVHVAGPALKPMAIARLFRKKFVVEHHGFQAICPNGLLLHKPGNCICPGHFQQGHYQECVRCEAQTMRFSQACFSVLRMFPRNALVKQAAANIAVSHAALKRLNLPRLRVIYHGLPEPNGDAKFPQVRQARESLVFAFIGRFVEEKGINLLLRAAELLRQTKREFKLLLIGDGPERKRIEHDLELTQLSNLVRITGYLRGIELAKVTSEVDVVIMPSIWEETAGMAAMEQMLSGKPVVAAQIGGLAEIVDETALTFPAGDAARLADCMRRVIDEPDLIAVLGEKARARAERMFSLRRMVEEHASLYRQIAHQPGWSG